ncbi:MAG: MFS transporter [Candidatus Bathyarchaeota archaeon]|nr:MFS transporter [Candidatus Bathyarchaeota archaeon]
MRIEEGGPGFFARVAGYMAALFATFIGYGMIQPLLSLHTSGFVGTSYLLVGVLISLIGLVKAGFGPVSGFLSDVYGRRRLAAVGAGAIAGSMALVYLSNSTAMLVAGFILYGAGQAMFFLAMMTAMVEAAGPEKRAVAMGLYEGGNGIAIMVGSATSSLLVGILGVPAVFGIAAAFSAVSILVCVFFIKETSPPSGARGPILDIKGLKNLISPAYLGAMYAAFLFMYYQSAFAAIIPLYTTQTGLLDVEGLALLFVAVAGATALGSLLSGPVSDRVGRRLPIAVGMVFTALSFAGLYVAAAPLLLVASSLALGFGTGFFHPVASALVADVSTPENRGKAFGFYRLLRDLGTFAGPAVAGIVSALLGVGSLFLLNAGLALLGCFLAIVVVKETLKK